MIFGRLTLLLFLLICTSFSRNNMAKNSVFQGEFLGVDPMKADVNAMQT